MATPILKAINALRTRGSNEDRPSPIGSSSGGFLTNSLSTTTGTAQERLNAMGSVGWLFAVVERISTAMAASEWQLYQIRRDEKVQLTDHPLLDLWQNPNPFYSQSEFLEDSSNHFELVGEMAWIIVRGMGGSIVELWPVRPDRIRPIPDKDDYISGYIYQVGKDEVPLETDDVVFTRRPNPTVPYRGIGQIQSVLNDIGSEQMAAAWQRNFFSNSALPGGLIEFDHSLSPHDFQRLVERWREQHQGVSNSHRIAILERGKWVERKYSQRDMQFRESRSLNRDTILGAWGFPHAMLGISEDVNLANAQAAELMFARWLIRPRLIRIRDKVNQTLVKQFGDDLYLDFTDPVPDDRDTALNTSERGFEVGMLTLNEARDMIGASAIEGGDTFKLLPQSRLVSEGGYRGGILTLNEAREQLGQEPILGGDEFKPEPEPETPAGNNIASITPPEQKQLPEVEKADDPFAPDEIELIEKKMLAGWERRLRHEMTAIVSVLTLGGRNTNVEAGLLDYHDWDWEKKYADEVREELTTAFDAALRAEGFMELAPEELLIEVPPVAVEQSMDQNQGSQIDEATTQKTNATDTLTKIEWTEPIREAVVYARNRAAELLVVTGSDSLVQSTKDRINVLVSRSIANRESVRTLAQAIRSDHMFTASRAEMIARTETAIALARGTYQAADNQGRDEKRWVTQGDDAVDRGSGAAPCLNNASQKWIKISEQFISGDDMTPAHPRCRCIVRYRTSSFFADEVEDELDDLTTPHPFGENPIRATEPQIKMIEEARCEHCNKLLQKKFRGGELYCTRCKNTTDFKAE